MPSSVPIATRAAGAVLALALAATACGASSRPELADPAELEIAPEILAFVAPDESQAIPAAAPPELLGLEAARSAAAKASALYDLGGLSVTAANPQIAAEARVEQSGIGDDGVPTAVASGAASAGVANDVPVVTTEVGSDVGPPIDEGWAPLRVDGESDGTPVDEDSTPTVVGSDETVADHGETTDQGDRSEPAGGPAALEAASTGPRLPQYDDPSEAFITASGRPFELFDTAAPTRPEPGVTDDTIRVGGLVSQSLAGFVFRPDVCRGAEARFLQANAAAELSRTVLFETCYDDAARIDLAEGLTATLVRDDVFAIVPVASPAFAVSDTLREANVPYFGSGNLPAFCGRTNAAGFGTAGAGSCPVLEARGYVALHEPVLAALASTWEPDAVPRRIVYAVEKGARGEAVAAARAFEAELIDLRSPRFAAMLPTSAQGPATDWGQVVAALLADRPEVVIIEAGSIEGLPSALRGAGFDGELVVVGHVDPLDIMDTDARLELAPLTVVSPGLDVATRTSEGWLSLVAAAEVVGLDERQIGLDFIDGYLAADVFVEAVAMTPEPLSRERLTNAVNDGWWYPGVEGVSCGSWWPAAHLAPVPCVSIARVNVFSDRLVPVLGMVETSPQLRFELR